MTAIIGIEDGGLVWIGADSCSSNEESVQTRRVPKIWRAGAYVIGVAGSCRVAEVARYFAKFPPPPSRGVLRHVVTEVVPSIKRALRKAGAIKEASDWGRGGPSGGDAHGGEIMIGVGPLLFTVDQEFCVSQTRDAYAAIGGGADVATGALFASEGMPVKKRLAIALRAAAHHAVGVRGPFATLHTRSIVC